MKANILFLLFSLFCTISMAQWDAISPIDFNEERVLAFSDGGSYYKFKKGNISASRNGMEKEMYVRIHILDERGLEALSRVAIPFRRQSEAVRFIKGRTINYENGELTIHELSSKDIYTQQKNKNISETIFALPKVQIGSIIEYTYTYITDNYFSTTWYFQGEFPNQYSKVTFSAGANFHYQPLIQAADQSKINKDLYQGTAVFFQKEIPAFVEEAFVPNLDAYLPKVMFQLVGVYSGGNLQPIFKDWKDLTQSVLLNPQVGSLRKPDKKLYKKVLPELDPPAKALQQMIDICEHVQDRIRWNGQHSFIAKDSRKLVDIYDSGLANSGEMNMVLTSLLQSAGLNAQPMLISTIDNGVAIKVHPFINQFNQIVCLVNIDSKEYILDACQRYTNYALPPENILGQEGWVLDKSKPYWHKVKARVLSQSMVICKLNLTDDAQLKGEVSELHLGYPEQNIYNLQKNNPEKFWATYLADDWKLEKGKISEGKDQNNGLRMSYQLASDEWAEKAGDLILCDVFKPWREEENPFMATERQYPIDLSYPYIHRKTFTLDIPPGFKVESYPKATSISLPQRAISFRMTSSLLNNGKSLKIETQIRVQRVQYKPLEVGLLRQIFEKQMQKESEPIVLKRI